MWVGVYCIVPANTLPGVFWILQVAVLCHGFGDTWIMSMGISKNSKYFQATLSLEVCVCHWPADWQAE